MKYWCYYTDVVRYLERVEKLCARKTEAPAYLVWQDDDGPSMIAGPGIEWHRGEGPPPDIDAVSLRVGRPSVTPRRTPPNRNAKSRKTWRSHSCVPCRHSWRHALGPAGPASTRPHRRTSLPPLKKSEQKEYEFSEIRSNLLTPRLSSTSPRHLARNAG